jgi:hypothetical protein
MAEKIRNKVETNNQNEDQGNILRKDATLTL